jgi:tricarballylate dehydrogenase
MDMAQVLVAEAGDAVRWLSGLGLKYRLMYERQAYKRPDGSYLFWGGLHVGNVDGGVGLIEDHTAVAAKLGTEVYYGARATGLVTEGDTVIGVTYETQDHETHAVRAESVILAAGGFEASAELREEHLGQGWANAKVRGTPYNVGDMITAALALGAAKGGDWSTCHSVQWDASAEDNESNRVLTNRLTRQSYQLGVVVNRDGKRFLDEGADFRNYTYAKYGREILKQPGSVSWQIFDAELRPALRPEEYDMPGIGMHVADTLEGLAAASGIDVDGFVKTVTEFNASIDRSIERDLTVKDGRAATVIPPKSNWANPIETAPYHAYPVTCGITFTFGGIKGDLNGRVLRDDGSVIKGLFACGEMLGGLFSGNYPGGSGLAAGMVFGRRSGGVA